MNDQVLRDCLVEFIHALGEVGRGVLLGGGYGLYLKQLHMAQVRQRTLIPAELWPAPRATEDLDLMLSAEIVADAHAMTVIRETLDRLGYQVVKGAEYLQFVRYLSSAQVVKIDLLTAQLDVLKQVPAIDADDRRARPDSSARPHLHAHPTEGALALNDSPLVIEISGTLSGGEPASVSVGIPHPFTYLLMKLTAYRDRRNDPDKDLGRHHALDIFRIVAMLTEPERDQVRERIRRFSDNRQVQSCAELVRSDFSHPKAQGLLAMRTHPLWQSHQPMDVFIEAIRDLLA